MWCISASSRLIRTFQRFRDFSKTCTNSTAPPPPPQLILLLTYYNELYIITATTCDCKSAFHIYWNRILRHSRRCLMLPVLQTVHRVVEVRLIFCAICPTWVANYHIYFLRCIKEIDALHTHCTLFTSEYISIAYLNLTKRRSYTECQQIVPHWKQYCKVILQRPFQDQSSADLFLFVFLKFNFK